MSISRITENIIPMKMSTFTVVGTKLAGKRMWCLRASPHLSLAAVARGTVTVAMVVVVREVSDIQCLLHGLVHTHHLQPVRDLIIWYVVTAARCSDQLKEMTAYKRIKFKYM